MSGLPTETGERLFKQQSKEDKRPFANRGNGIDTDAVCIDRHNFESESDIGRFLGEIRIESNTDFIHHIFGRKSLIPDPEIIISLVSLSKIFAVCWAIKKTKIGEKVEELTAEEIDKFYKFTRAVIFKGVKYLIPKNRPKTYVFIVSTTPSIEFVAVTNDADKLISAISIENFQEAIKKTSTLADHFTISRIQFLLDENGDWKFNFLLTNSGEVIGTEKSLSRRAERIELLENNRTTKALVDKSVKNLLNKIGK